MKKVLAICLMTAMFFTMSIAAFAENGGFVSSPSRNQAPEIVDFDPTDDSCTAQAVVTAYADRNALSDDLKALLEKAYGEIVGAEDLTTLNSDLASLANEKNIDGKNLSASDLFDISVNGCDSHGSHAGFKVTLKADTLNNFVALLHMTDAGVWELVSDAKLEDDGKNLTFTVNDFTPFAIIVNTNPGSSTVTTTTEDSDVTTVPSDTTDGEGDDEGGNVAGTVAAVAVATAAAGGGIAGAAAYYKKRKKSSDD